MTGTNRSDVFTTMDGFWRVASSKKLLKTASYILGYHETLFPLIVIRRGSGFFWRRNFSVYSSIGISARNTPITIVNSNVRRDLLHLGGLIFSLCHDESNTWPADFKVLLNYILNNEQVDPGGYYLHSLHNKSLNWAGSLFRSFVFKVKECRHSSSHFNLGLLLIIINLVLHLYHPNLRVSLLRKFLGKCACIIIIPRYHVVTRKGMCIEKKKEKKKWSAHANAMYLMPISFWK